MWSWRLWRRGASPGAPREVVLYTRRGCHLCEEAHAALEAARRDFAFTLECVDVDSDAALAERYGLEVPVVTIDGVVRFRGRVNPVLLRRTLRAGRPP